MNKYILYANNKILNKKYYINSFLYNKHSYKFILYVLISLWYSTINMLIHWERVII